jgi:preprotein translocase subunit YajC
MNTTFLLFQGGGSSLISLLLPFLVIGAIFYFLVILPQRRQQKELQNMIANLKNGDEIVTSGGIIGKIIELRETSLIIRSAEKSNMEIGKSAVVGMKPEAEKK